MVRTIPLLNYRDGYGLPRLSVGVDLIYLPIEDRQTSLQEIDAIFKQVKNVQR